LKGGDVVSLIDWLAVGFGMLTLALAQCREMRNGLL
jgi:hypothetical protein